EAVLRIGNRNHAAERQADGLGVLGGVLVRLLERARDRRPVYAIDGGDNRGVAVAILSGRFRKYGDTERCHWWMPGADAGLDVYWTYTRVRGQSQAPPGVPRMSSYLRNRPLRLRLPGPQPLGPCRCA